MGLTNKQELETKPVPSEPWTFKRLFPFSGSVSSISKVFVNPLELMLAWIIFAISIAVLCGRPVPALFYGLAVGCLIEVDYERLREPKKLEFFEKDKKEKKK